MCRYVRNSQACVECAPGYRPPAQFAKAFRRHVGVAPSDFRARRAARAGRLVQAA